MIPRRRWTNLRAFQGPFGNDGGQRHDWPHHNGAATDPADWLRNADLYEIADLTAFEDQGDYLYLAGDLTRAYSPNKLAAFTRQIVYLRPGTFVIFDRVRTTKPEYRKTWQLQAAKPPSGTFPELMVDNGQGGRLFVQSVLPAQTVCRLYQGDSLYSYDGQNYAPEQVRGPAPECRIEVSPATAAQEDFFLHVLTAADDSVESVPRATAESTPEGVLVTLGETRITFATKAVGGLIQRGSEVHALARNIAQQD